MWPIVGLNEEPKAMNSDLEFWPEVGFSTPSGSPYDLEGDPEGDVNNLSFMLAVLVSYWALTWVTSRALGGYGYQ
jgi:hypothetical protein